MSNIFVVVTVAVVYILTPRECTLSKTQGILLRDLLKLSRDVLPKSARGSTGPFKHHLELKEMLRNVGLHEEDYRRPSAQFILHLYNRLQHGDNLLKASGHGKRNHAILRSNTIRSFASSGPTESDHGYVTLTFNVSSVHARETVRLAEIRMPRLQHKHTGKKKQRILVSILREDSTIRTLAYRVPIREKGKQGSTTLDITNALRDIVAMGYTNYPIVISFRDRSSSKLKTAGIVRSRRSTPSDYISSNHKDAYESMLVVYSQDKDFFQKLTGFVVSFGDTSKKYEATRSKRSSFAERKRKKPRCTKHDFYVDFNDIGWGQWIVYPKRFNARYCHGRCPMPVEPHFNPTNHAVLQSLMRLKNRKVPRPCCVPSKLQPLSMLYYEHNEIVVRHHENMVVDSCGCR